MGKFVLLDLEIVKLMNHYYRPKLRMTGHPLIAVKCLRFLSKWYLQNPTETNACFVFSFKKIQVTLVLQRNTFFFSNSAILKSFNSSSLLEFETNKISLRTDEIKLLWNGANIKVNLINHRAGYSIYVPIFWIANISSYTQSIISWWQISECTIN